MNPYLLYTFCRLAIFLVVAAVLYFLGFSPLLLIALALIISLPLSAVLLKNQRARLTEDMSRRMQARRDRQERLRGALREDQED